MARLSAKQRLGVSPLWQPVLGIGIQFLLNLLIRSHLVALAFVLFGPTRELFMAESHKRVGFYDHRCVCKVFKIVFG